MNNLTLSVMEDEKHEFFKLDAIDREVLLWIITHVPKSAKSWIEYIAQDYRKRKSILIDAEKMYEEVREKNRLLH
jgi:hypothetical protein